MDTKFKDLMFILCTLILMNSRIVKPSVLLSPNVTLSSGICPQVTFNCTAVDLPSTTLRWFIDDIIITAYPYDPVNHQFPYNETLILSSWTDVVTIQIVEASYSDNTLDRANFYSTLTANLSAIVKLGGNNISCGSTGTKSAVIAINDFDYIAPPTRPLLECSLVISSRGLTVSFDFDSFSSGTNYHVVTNSTPSSCRTDQLVGPSDDYNCSGLVLGTCYSFNINAINCGNQEGVERTIIVHPQVPLIPEIVVFSTYNEDSLSQLTVMWKVKSSSISDVCSFDNSLNYSIFLEDGRGGRLEERVVNSDSCNNNLCSTSFNIFSSQSYVFIYAVNAFGQSNTSVSTSIGNLLQSEVLNSTLTFEDCITTFHCSSVLAEGSCFVQYGRDSSYENFDNHLNVSLNSPSPLPLMDASTQYYFQVEVRVNSTFYRSRRSFMTGKFAAHLTDVNLGLLIIDIIFLIMGIIMVIMCIPVFRKYRSSTGASPAWIASLVLLIVAFCTLLVSICLLIAVGGVVGPQKYTCNIKWQSTRDNLIIAGFVLSFIFLLLCITADAVILAVTYCKCWSGVFNVQMQQLNKGDIIDLNGFGTLKPELKPKTPACLICEKKFTYWFTEWRQRHRCMACGENVCGLCSVNMAELPYDSKTKQRVCDNCCKKCFIKGYGVYDPRGNHLAPPNTSDTSQPPASPVSGKDPTTNSEASNDRSNLINDSTTTKTESSVKFESQQKPEWEDDKATKVCRVCDKKFTFVHRRHHCRTCGKVVCKNCWGKEVPVNFSNKEEKVCNPCYQSMKKT